MKFASSKNVTCEPDGYHDFVELCSGVQRFSKTLRALGFVGMSMDIVYSEALYDLLCPMGLCMFVAAVWRIKKHGVLLMAPPCSSWVWMNMGTSKRKKTGELDEWKGNPDSHKIRSQNRFISRLSCVFELCRRRNVFLILEQPKDSIMFKHVRLLAATKRNPKLTFKTIKQGAFGANSAKDTELLTDLELVGANKKMGTLDKQAIADFKRAGGQMSKAYIDSNGKRKTTGGQDLKSGQEYPFGFCSFLACSYKNEKDRADELVKDAVEVIDSSPSCTSSDADSDNDMFTDVKDNTNHPYIICFFVYGTSDF